MTQIQQRAYNVQLGEQEFMPSFTYPTPYSLSSEELTALREKKFELHCPKMKLESLASAKRVFSGPGAIRQTPEGKIRFTLYAQENISDFEVIKALTEGMNLPLGAIIPRDKFYRLSATDLRGHTWECAQVMPDTDSSNEGTICTGKLDEITYKDESVSAKNFIYLEIFGNVKIPCNTPTVIEKTVAGKKSLPSSSIDSLQFNACGLEFMLHNEESSLRLSAEATDIEFGEHIETRIIEALQFVLARPLLWSIMIKNTGNSKITCIRNIHSDNLRYEVEPPISPSRSNTESFCKLFDLYLKHVLQHTQNTLHPFSAQLRSICLASAVTMEAQTLILSVGIENILKHIHETGSQLSPTEKEWLGKAQEYFCSWGGPDDLSKRIASTLSKLGKPSASMRLRELVKSGAIRDEHRKAWEKLRHKLAHGETIGSQPLQEFLELRNAVLVLFYHLVFFEIGYEGKYTDYSTINYPTRDYQVIPLSENAGQQPSGLPDQVGQ